mmetsp:Transcript_99189/g.303281  ORF Transcript_99189/g.303281 Transcript_99189/m.303281 type:complete len:215 (+) Transcript_99189:1175-1819(+)
MNGALARARPRARTSAMDFHLVPRRRRPDGAGTPGGPRLSGPLCRLRGPPRPTWTSRRRGSRPPRRRRTSSRPQGGRSRAPAGRRQRRRPWRATAGPRPTPSHYPANNRRRCRHKAPRRRRGLARGKKPPGRCAKMGPLGSLPRPPRSSRARRPPRPLVLMLSPKPPPAPLTRRSRARPHRGVKARPPARPANPELGAQRRRWPGQQSQAQRCR